MIQNDGSELTLLIGGNLDLKARVYGEYSSPGEEVYVSSWLKQGAGDLKCSGSCKVDAGGKWEIKDFLLLAPENFSESERTCCVQAVVQPGAGGQVVRSTILEVTPALPYEIAGQNLKVKTYNGLASAMHVAETGARSACVISVTSDIVVQTPFVPALACELQGGQHTLTCICHRWKDSLFDRFTEKAVLKDLRIDYPDWLEKENTDNGDWFAGVVRENKGCIQGCTVSLDIRMAGMRCAAVAFESGKGSRILNCKVKGKLKGKSVGGMVYHLSEGSVTDCEVTADFDFQEFGGGVVVCADTKSTVKNCSYEGTLLSGRDVTYAGSRLVGGVVAVVEGGSAVENCRVEADLDLWLSGVGGYAGGIAGKCVNSTISCCGSSVKPLLSWIFGGIVGKLVDSGKVSRCAAYGKEKMKESMGVVGGLVGDIGAHCAVSDSYASQFLRSAVYGGGLVGYASQGSEDASVERCYCTSALGVKLGGGIKMRSGVTVRHCVGIHSFLSATEEMGRTGFGGKVEECIAFKDTQTVSGKTITDTGEVLKEADLFFKQETFQDLGWDFTDVWEMQAGYPRLRGLTFAQSYTYPFLRLLPPSVGNKYVFKSGETVSFSGYVNPRATSYTWKLSPHTNSLPLSGLTVSVTSDQWTLAIGKLAVREYRLVLTLLIDDVTFALTVDFAVE